MATLYNCLKIYGFTHRLLITILSRPWCADFLFYIFYKRPSRVFRISSSLFSRQWSIVPPILVEFVNFLCRPLTFSLLALINYALALCCPPPPLGIRIFKPVCTRVWNSIQTRNVVPAPPLNWRCYYFQWQLHRDYKRTLPTGRQAPPIPHPEWTLTGLAVYCPVSSNIYYASGALLFHTFFCRTGAFGDRSVRSRAVVSIRLFFPQLSLEITSHALLPDKLA